MVHPLLLGLEGDCARKEGKLLDEALHRDRGLREEVGERRQENASEVERGQKDWQGACCVTHDEQCLLHSDLWKQQSVLPTGRSRKGRMSMCWSGTACQVKGQGEERVFRRKESNSRVTFLHLPSPHSLCLFVQSGPSYVV